MDVVDGADAALLGTGWSGGPNVVKDPEHGRKSEADSHRENNRDANSPYEEGKDAEGPAAVAAAAAAANEHQRDLFCPWRNSARSPIGSA